MLALNINNQEIENYYKEQCNSNENTFIENILQYIKTHQIKESIKKGFSEVEEMKQGKRHQQNLNDFLNEL